MENRISNPTNDSSLIASAKALIGKTITNIKGELKDNATKIPPVVLETSKPVPSETQKAKPSELKLNFISPEITDSVRKQVSRENLKSIADPDIFSDEALATIQLSQYVFKDSESNNTSESGSSDKHTDYNSASYNNTRTRDTASEALGNLVNTKI